MPIGDNDLATGVFFKDFGVDVVFGGLSVKGNFDAPGKDAMFAGSTGVSDNEYRVEVSCVAFSPMPEVKDRLTVDGASYVVTDSNPLDDGKTVELRLRKL
jgi:hypothetical protein